MGQTAHKAGWWADKPQQASQPVMSSQLLQDEQLAQKLQQEEDRQRQGTQSQGSNPTGHGHPGQNPGRNTWGYPPQEAQEPLNLWHPPAQNPPQQQQHQGNPSYQQGYPSNLQNPQPNNTWWSPGPGNTGYPQVCRWLTNSSLSLLLTIDALLLKALFLWRCG